jgi:hypothetical protein
MPSWSRILNLGLTMSFARIVVVASAFATLFAAAGTPARDIPAPSARSSQPKLALVTPTANEAALAQALAGPGVTITNARLVGASNAAGTFSGAGATVGLDQGIVLSTGNVADLIGPNNEDDTSTIHLLPGDADLDRLVAPFPTRDAVILEFDVTAAASTVGIRFVFASEEYNEFVDSPFNDVVAIYVNGVNCANYNGRPVSVNTINAGLNAALFVDNTNGVRNIEMDGLTVPLDCIATVTPNVPVHVKIAIADTSDEILDAAVFLAAGGVVSPGSGPPTSTNIARAIEYYHAAFDHYFATAIPDEITKLDNGTFVGWERSGEAFNVFLVGVPGTAEVCRFFSTAFGLKSSHFYTPDASECALVKQNPNWQFEAAVFGVMQPAADGSCGVGLQPLYRLYNDGQGGAPNHRYTTSLATFFEMQGKGWKPEGSGVGVIACVPT